VTEKRRVVVTGMGVVAPNASSIDDFREALIAGRSGVGPITIFDTADLPTRIAGESRLPEGGGGAHRLKDRKILFALEAARQAYAAATACGSIPAGVGGVSMGVGLELFAMEDLVRSRQPGFVLP
jgi:3-oxoacyl-[acyl-carrier-protein] synthase II